MAKKLSEKEIKFTKEQFLKSKKYESETDLINTLLKDGELYTFTEVDELITNFLEREVI